MKRPASAINEGHVTGAVLCIQLHLTFIPAANDGWTACVGRSADRVRRRYRIKLNAIKVDGRRLFALEVERMNRGYWPDDVLTTRDD